MVVVKLRRILVVPFCVLLPMAFLVYITGEHTNNNLLTGEELMFLVSSVLSLMILAPALLDYKMIFNDYGIKWAIRFFFLFPALTFYKKSDAMRWDKVFEVDHDDFNFVFSGENAKKTCHV